MVAKLEAELEREKLERDWSMSELDRVKSFWEITKRDLEDKKAELRNTESNVEGVEERHQLEIKVTRLTSVLRRCQIACRVYLRRLRSFGKIKTEICCKLTVDFFSTRSSDVADIPRDSVHRRMH